MGTAWSYPFPLDCSFTRLTHLLILELDGSCQGKLYRINQVFLLTHRIPFFLSTLGPLRDKPFIIPKEFTPGNCCPIGVDNFPTLNPQGSTQGDLVFTLHRGKFLAPWKISQVGLLILELDQLANSQVPQQISGAEIPFFLHGHWSFHLERTQGTTSLANGLFSPRVEPFFLRFPQLGILREVSLAPEKPCVPLGALGFRVPLRISSRHLGAQQNHSVLGTSLFRPLFLGGYPSSSIWAPVCGPPAQPFSSEPNFQSGLIKTLGGHTWAPLSRPL